MKIEKVNFVVHFDVLMEHDVNALYASEEQIDSVLKSTQLGFLIERVEDEDLEGEIFCAGDIDLTDQESYFNLLQGMPTYSVISAGFGGKFVGSVTTDWSNVRAWMTELRRRSMPAEGRWSAYTEAPVTISLSHMEISQVGTHPTRLELSSKTRIREFLTRLKSQTSNNQSVKDFLDYFAPEIERFQQNDVSTFLEYWFSTELLLTQKELRFVQVGDSYKSLVPDYSLEDFEWVRPANLNMFLEGERAWSPSKVFWYTPVPGNPFRSGSDPEWHYSAVAYVEKRVGLSSTEYSKNRFAITMNALRTYVEEYDVEDASFEINSFYERYSHEINEISDQMRDSHDWNVLIELDGEEANFLQQLKFPENALSICDDYLKTILRAEPTNLVQAEPEHKDIADFTEYDYIAAITSTNSPDEFVAQNALEYCKEVLVPNKRHAEAFCVSQIVNRYYFSNLVPSAAFETANEARSVLEAEGYEILEPSTFEVRPKGDNPWNYSRTKQTIVEISVWSSVRNSELTQVVASLPRPISLAAEFDFIYTILNSMRSSTTDHTLEFFRSGLDGQGDVAEIFETGRWLTGYYIHKMIWPG